MRNGLVLGMALGLQAAMGQEPASTSPTPAPAARVVAADKVAPPSQAPAVVNTAEVLKLAAAGVSPEVIRSYIESAASVSAPSAADLIALKEHQVPDEVTVALLKRSAEMRGQTTISAATLARVLGSGRAVNGGFTGGIDPESYAYFQHYYLYPRTLSWVYDQLGYYRYPYPYGYPWWR